MSTHQCVTRDERTVAVENVSSRWGVTFLLFALLVDVAYRGLVGCKPILRTLASTWLLLIVPFFGRYRLRESGL